MPLNDEDKARRARDMRDMSPWDRDEAIALSVNVADARYLFAQRRPMRLTEDDCA